MREYFGYKEMPHEDFRALQLIELEMLVYFDKFCKKHNLRYFLAGGTLIGAVRHKGFIPWDEDVDVHMPRPDYNKLVELWEKDGDKDKYTLCLTNKEKNFRHNACALSKNDTTMIEERTVNDDIPQGIRMDIIPFDGVPENKIKADIQFFWAIIFSIFNVQRLPENQGGAFMRNTVKLALWLIKNPESRYKIWKYALMQIEKYSFDDSPWVRELIAPLRSMRFKYPRNRFDEAVLVEFEGHLFPAQFYYKDYLKNAFNDYMQLPPVEKRVQKTKAIYINLDKSYKEYKGIYYCKDNA